MLGRLLKISCFDPLSTSRAGLVLSLLNLWSLVSGEIMGSVFRFSLEHYRMADAVELFREDCKFNRTEVPEEAARNRNVCFEKECGGE